MKLLEKFRQMTTMEGEQKEKLVRLQAEFADREAKQGTLDDAALMAEVMADVMGGPEASALKKTAQEAAARIPVLRFEIEKSKRALIVLGQEKAKIEVATVDELRDQYHPEMEKACKHYLKCLKEAAAGEVRIKELTESVNDAARNAGIQRMLTLEPTGSIVIGIEKENLISPAVARCRQNGYNVD